MIIDVVHKQQYQYLKITFCLNNYVAKAIPQLACVLLSLFTTQMIILLNIQRFHSFCCTDHVMMLFVLLIPQYEWSFYNQMYKYTQGRKNRGLPYLKCSYLHIKFSLWPLPPPNDGNPRLLGYYIQFLHWGPMYIYIYIQFVYHVLLVYVNVPYLVFDFINIHSNILIWNYLNIKLCIKDSLRE